MRRMPHKLLFAAGVATPRLQNRLGKPIMTNRLLVPAFLSLGILAVVPVAYASPLSNDGIYDVEIITEHGACDKTYHWSVAIADGQVKSTGDMFADTSGHIDSKGTVSLAFRKVNHIANAAGRLAAGAGQGTWSSATLQCGGRWHAARQSSASR